MYIKLSELKTDPAKYFDLAKNCEVIVTRHGERLGRIVSEERTAEMEKLNTFNEIMRCLKEMQSISVDTVYDEIKEARLKERGLL